MSFPLEPIMPGASNVIKVKSDTNRVGPPGCFLRW